MTMAAIGTVKGLFLLDGDEMTGPLFPGERVTAFAFAGGDRMLAAAVSDHWGPTLRTSDDRGRTWTDPEQRVIAFPESAGEWTDHFSEVTKPAALAQVWQLAVDGDRVWAGVEPAALFRSDDGGRTFAMVEGLWNHPHRPKWFPGGGGLALHTILVDPRDRDRLHVAISTGGVYRSDDGGQTWEPRNEGVPWDFFPDNGPDFGQCVHKVVRDAADADVLYMQHHPGLFRSDDRGDKWVDIGTGRGVPSDFGFPMVAHPAKGGTVYAIPLASDGYRCTPEGRCRVYRTSDGGESWSP